MIVVHFCSFSSQPDIQIHCDKSWTQPAWDQPDEGYPPGVHETDDGAVRYYTFFRAKVTCPACLASIANSKEPPMPEETKLATSKAQIIIACARAAHEVNRAYCIAIGDTSQVPWDEAPTNIQASAQDGVVGVLNGNTPEQSHEGWLAFKKQDGWRYGEVKDAHAKTHPCLVPYAELSPDQRAKDGIFCTVVAAVAKALGLEVMPHTPPQTNEIPPAAIPHDQPVPEVSP